MRQLGWALAASIAVSSVAVAQTPSFDVASVKVNHSGARTTRIASPRDSGRFDVTNAMVHTLILNAYGLQDFQLTGGPAWISDTRFDIAARTSPGTSREDISAMLRSLLVERFHLATHREPREMPTYALTLARKDGRVGLQLKTSPTPCPAATPAAQGPPPVSPSGQVLCGISMTPSELNAGNLTMARLATTLSGIVGRMVTDETGLTGPYDLHLTFTPENPGSSVAGPPVATDDNAASIFAALTEQLGLKLEPRRAPVDVVVIDDIEMPTED